MKIELKRRGRPRVDASDTSVQVGVTLPTRQFNRLCTTAIRYEVSLPEVIRRLVYGPPLPLKTSKK